MSSAVTTLSRSGAVRSITSWLFIHSFNFTDTFKSSINLSRVGKFVPEFTSSLMAAKLFVNTYKVSCRTGSGRPPVAVTCTEISSEPVEFCAPARPAKAPLKSKTAQTPAAICFRLIGSLRKLILPELPCHAPGELLPPCVKAILPFAASRQKKIKRVETPIRWLPTPQSPDAARFSPEQIAKSRWSARYSHPAPAPTLSTRERSSPVHPLPPAP